MNLLTGALLGVLVVALAGLLLLAPLLAILRSVGYGGPLAVIGISTAVVISFSAGEPMALLVAALLAAPSVYLFCNRAYGDAGHEW